MCIRVYSGAYKIVRTVNRVLCVCVYVNFMKWCSENSRKHWICCAFLYILSEWVAHSLQAAALHKIQYNITVERQKIVWRRSFVYLILVFILQLILVLMHRLLSSTRWLVICIKMDAESNTDITTRTSSRSVKLASSKLCTWQRYPCLRTHVQHILWFHCKMMCTIRE